MTADASRLSVAYLLTPVIAVAVALPGIVSVPPFSPPNSSGDAWVYYMAAIPFWLGLASSPGYFYAWAERWRSNVPRLLTDAWVHSSLLGAMVASVGGTALMTLTGILWVFPAICVGLTAALWRRYVRGRQQQKTRHLPRPSEI